MQLLMSPASPFARTARVALREAGLLDTVTEVAVTTTAMATEPAVAAANPAGKIPVLLRADGPAIHDSRVICRYFDHLGAARLYPEPRLWETLTLEATGTALSDAAVAMVYEARFKGTEGKSADWIEAQWQKAVRILAAVDGRWMSHLAGPADAGQIAVACALGYLDFRHEDRDWRSLAPALAGWFEGFAARPPMVDTDPG